MSLKLSPESEVIEWRVKSGWVDVSGSDCCTDGSAHDHISWATASFSKLWTVFDFDFNEDAFSAPLPPQLDNLTLMEINTIRSFFLDSLNCMYKLRSNMQPSGDSKGRFTDYWADTLTQVLLQHLQAAVDCVSQSVSQSCYGHVKTVVTADY